MQHFLLRHAPRRLCQTVAVALTWASASCGSSSESPATRAPITRAAAPATAGIVDVARMLSLAQYITDTNVGAHGSCLATAARPERSRLLYLIVSEDTAFIRLNVVTSADGARVGLIDFVRGLPTGGQWSATQARLHDPVVTRAFASISDHEPRVSSLGGYSPDAQSLRDLADAALRLACASS